HRFLEAYRRLAQMPAPALREITLGPLVARAAGLETRLKVCVEPGPDLAFQADPDQLEQMLINLIRNAADAVLETRTAEEQTAKAASQKNGVVVRWDADREEVTLAIEDEGPGLLNPANVFTPFYTTKPSGSGVGLVLSRQIAEAHGGSIDIANRPSGRGCVVRVILPRAPAQSSVAAS
ncbi:MAG: sensor histidine kinase, partial [Acidobacteriota bacterium]